MQKVGSKENTSSSIESPQQRGCLRGHTFTDKVVMGFLGITSIVEMGAGCAACFMQQQLYGSFLIGGSIAELVGGGRLWFAGPEKSAEVAANKVANTALIITEKEKDLGDQLSSLKKEKEGFSETLDVTKELLESAEKNDKGLQKKLDEVKKIGDSSIKNLDEHKEEVNKQIEGVQEISKRLLGNQEQANKVQEKFLTALAAISTTQSPSEEQINGLAKLADETKDLLIKYRVVCEKAFILIENCKSLTEHFSEEVQKTHQTNIKLEKQSKKLNKLIIGYIELLKSEKEARAGRKNRARVSTRNFSAEGGPESTKEPSLKVQKRKFLKDLEKASRMKKV